MTKQTAKQFVFRVTLQTGRFDRKHSKPYRDLAISGTDYLSDLAEAITKVFDFSFDHCYGFYSKKPYSDNDSEFYELFFDLKEDPTPGSQSVEETQIGQVFTSIGKKMHFLFDYGDNWLFTVRLTKINPLPTNQKFPQLIKSAGDSPDQYPDYEDELDELFADADSKDMNDFLSDDCPLCKMLKEEGIDLHWFPDEPESMRKKPQKKPIN